MYGGGHRYIVREDISERGIITYVEKNNPDKMLTINQYWELDTPYIMVHLTDTKGVIIRKDRFDYTKRRLEYVYTEENGHYYETFSRGRLSLRVNILMRTSLMQTFLFSKEGNYFFDGGIYFRIFDYRIEKTRKL